MSATQHHATASIETTSPFKCAACGFEANAAVEGFGAGTATTVGGPLGGSRYAARDATDEAESSAWADALSSVEMAECPKCHVRSDEAMRRFLRSRVVPSLSWGVLAGVIGTVGTCVLRSMPDSTDAYAGAAMSAVVALVTFVVPVRRKLAATTRVRFEPGASATPPHV